ncbi:hypothetical protein [Pseudoteredinibacter isoporae]|uniref:Uncharacterized protein n=1 Tax=Pseudoteredinibacter isoporae TaxID=570281 RepID=A0A7X0JPS8_9GAMM|nr:hypothetical protein [Pseudoteredinibacter isoporae]MBB6520025.1 hypothetical protein [Pseudoteredinibacter isoporae]NHO85597.1 hypothetical protein [Pseudoteredinibacter isoporae]NIB25951.1 hypothetical protein [Pseudoteredinibacter isoporae]
MKKLVLAALLSVCFTHAVMAQDDIVMSDRDYIFSSHAESSEQISYKTLTSEEMKSTEGAAVPIVVAIGFGALGRFTANQFVKHFISNGALAWGTYSFAKKMHFCAQDKEGINPLC